MKNEVYFALCLSVAAGCGGVALPSTFQAPIAPTEEAVAERLKHPRERTERPVVVALTTAPVRLCAWDLSGGALWKLPVDARGRPLVAGDAVVLHEAGGIVVRDLATGAVRTTLDDEGRLIAADGIGSEVVVALADADDETRGELVFVSGESVVWRRPLSQIVGTPALVGDQVLVPWGHQRLSVLSSLDGSELARWDFTSFALAQALVDRGHVYVGQYGLVRLTAELPGQRQAPIEPYSPLKRALPGQPAFLRDGYAVVPELGHASERVSATFRPSASEVGAAEQDLLLSRFYRVLIGMHASRDELRFVRTFERDLVATSIEAGVVLVVDEVGSVRGIDATGADLFMRDLGESLQAATLRAGSWPSAIDAQGFKTVSAKPGKDRLETLHSQLLEVARLPDDRLGVVRMFALDQLAQHQGPSVTAELIQFCADRSTSESVRNTACEHVAARDEGGSAVIEALRRRASFLEGMPEPPVAALSRAAARMKLKQAAPYLLSHAEDPNTHPSELVFVFEALDALGHRAAIGMLERFVRLHHAEPSGSELSKPLYAALNALGNLRAKNARETLTDIADDGLTLEPVRQKAREVLGVIDAPPRGEPPAPKAVPPQKAEPEPAPQEIEIDPRPWSVDGASVRSSFKPVRAQLLRCLEGEPNTLKSARIALVLTGQGEVEGSFVTPTSAQPCMEPILRTLKFPATRIGREHVTHTLELVPEEVEAPAGKPQVSAGKPQVYAGKPQVPASKTQVQASKAQVPASKAQVPASKTQVPAKAPAR